MLGVSWIHDLVEYGLHMPVARTVTMTAGLSPGHCAGGGSIMWQLMGNLP